MSSPEPHEISTLHDMGDCTVACPHPDHQYDDPFEIPTDAYDQLVRDLFEMADEWHWDEDR